MDNKINYWLIKSEPSTWSWSDQKKLKKICGMGLEIIKPEII